MSDDELTKAVASALWYVGQGYSVEDVRAVGGDPTDIHWSAANADDYADEALHRSHAVNVLKFLADAGWKPPADEGE